MESLRLLANLLMKIAAFSVLPATIIALWRLPSASQPQRLIAWFVLFSAATEMTGYLLAQKGLYNLWVAHLVTLVRFPLLASLYQAYVPKPWLRVLILAFMAFALLDSLLLEDPLLEFNAIGRSVEAVLLLGLTLWFLYQLLLRSNLHRLERVPLVWATLSILLFFSGSLVIYSFNNELLQDPQYSDLFGGLYGLFLVAHYALFAVALLLPPEADRELAASQQAKPPGN